MINELSDATEDDDLQEIQNKVDKVGLEVLLEGTSQLIQYMQLVRKVCLAKPGKLATFSASNCCI